MDINERSKEYAEGKALSALNAAIEQAYKDGYNDGLKHLELERLEAIKEGVEYVDLNLKSGTLWSSKYVKFGEGVPNKIPFMEASQLNIPTKEDFRELCRECRASYVNKTNFHGIKFTGINGNSIEIEYTDSEGGTWVQGNACSFRFWLKEKGEKDNEKKVAAIRMNDNVATPLIFDMFMGLRLPVMLVKKNE